jgi:hypothetical protein
LPVKEHSMDLEMSRDQRLARTQAEIRKLPCGNP